MIPILLLMYLTRVLDYYRYCINTVDSLNVSTESSGLLYPQLNLLLPVQACQKAILFFFCEILELCKARFKHIHDPEDFLTLKIL